MCGYFCIGFLDFIFANKILIDFTSLFSPYDFEYDYGYDYDLDFQ